MGKPLQQRRSPPLMLIAAITLPLAMIGGCVGIGAITVYRLTRIEPPIVDGRDVVSWIELAESSVAEEHDISVAALEKAMASIRNRGPMNCAGGIVFLDKEQRRIKSVQAAVRLHFARIVGILEKAGQSDIRQVRYSAIRALAYVSFWDEGKSLQRVLPVLIEATKSDDLEMQRSAREGVIHNLTYGSRGLSDFAELPVDELIPILTFSELDSHLQYEAVVILGLIGEDANVALPHLEQIIRQAESEPNATNVVQQARWAMSRLRGQK